MTRDPKDLALIWRHTHRDFKGGKGDDRAIMVNGGARGSILVRLVALDDATFEKEIAYARGAEERAKARAAAKALAA